MAERARVSGGPAYQPVLTTTALAAARAAGSDWRPSAARILVAAALGTDKRTTKVLANALVEVAKARANASPANRSERVAAPARVRELATSWQVPSSTPGERVAVQRGVPVGSSEGLIRLGTWPAWPQFFRSVPGWKSTPEAQPIRSTTWDVCRPLLSISFSAVVGLSSMLTPTSASVDDYEAQRDFATAACWREMPEEHTHADQTVHLHYVTIPCTSLPVQRLSVPNGDQLTDLSAVEEVAEVEEVKKVEAEQSPASLSISPPTDGDPVASLPNEEPPPLDVDLPQPAAEPEETTSEPSLPGAPAESSAKQDEDGQNDDRPSDKNTPDVGAATTTEEDTGGGDESGNQ